MNRRNHNLLWRQTIHQHTNRRYIRNRIHHSYLVEVNLSNWNAMCIAFSFRYQRIDRENVCFYLFSYRQLFNNMFYIMHTAMMMWMFFIVGMPMGVFMFMFIFMGMGMPIFMAMLVQAFMHFFGFFFAVHFNSDMRSPNPAFYRCLSWNRHAWNTKAVEFGYESISIREQFQQCRCQHISCSAHAWNNITSFVEVRIYRSHN